MTIYIVHALSQSKWESIFPVFLVLQLTIHTHSFWICTANCHSQPAFSQDSLWRKSVANPYNIKRSKESNPLFRLSILHFPSLKVTEVSLPCVHPKLGDPEIVFGYNNHSLKRKKNLWTRSQLTNHIAKAHLVNEVWAAITIQKVQLGHTIAYVMEI